MVNKANRCDDDNLRVVTEGSMSRTAGQLSATIYAW